MSEFLKEFLKKLILEESDDNKSMENSPSRQGDKQVNMVPKQAEKFILYLGPYNKNQTWFSVH